jgi:hypothetical protein
MKGRFVCCVLFLEDSGDGTNTFNGFWFSLNCFFCYNELQMYQDFQALELCAWMNGAKVLEAF